jgi:hypothetical protein
MLLVPGFSRYSNDTHALSDQTWCEINQEQSFNIAGAERIVGNGPDVQSD